MGAGIKNDVVGRVDIVVGRGASDSDESDLPRVSADVYRIRHNSNLCVLQGVTCQHTLRLVNQLSH